MATALRVGRSDGRGGFYVDEGKILEEGSAATE
jgi:hypothetical protein